MRERPSRPASNALRYAIETGDLPTAALWMTRVRGAKPFERGVAMMEALLDPLFDGEEHERCFEALLSSIEDGLALEEAGAMSLLAILSADAKRRLSAAEHARVAFIARMFDARAAVSADRKRYATTRATLIDRVPPRRSDSVWRLDRSGGVISRGKTMSVSIAAAVTLAQLRKAAQRLCSTVSEDGVGRFADYDDNFVDLEVECAANVLASLREQCRDLENLARVAAAQLVSVGK